MSAINNGGPAFPVVTRENCEDGSNQFGHQFSHSTWQFPGMTLRDYFAAKAMQGVFPHAGGFMPGWAIATGKLSCMIDDLIEAMGGEMDLAGEAA